MKVSTVIIPVLQMRKIRGKNDLCKTDPLQADLTEERCWLTADFYGNRSGLIALNHGP